MMTTAITNDPLGPRLRAGASSTQPVDKPVDNFFAARAPRYLFLRKSAPAEHEH